MALNELTIAEAKEGLKEKKFSVTELVEACLGQIKNFDSQVKAYLTVADKEALSQAAALDKEGDKEGLALWGIPVAVKDNFSTTGLRTTAASKVLENYLPVYDATVVKKLKEAGAIILGKTNMDAWAHGSSTETSQFFVTHNPWDLTRLPGGSSGGTAAAVAADLTIGGIGSETAGSIRQPASWCGVVGFKPTYGVVSRWGLLAMASSLDCPGPMTKSVADARLLFEAIRGRDPQDATSVDFSPRQSGQKLSSLKIGLPREYFPAGMEEETKEKVLAVRKVFEKMGFSVEEVSLLDPHLAVSVYTIVQRSEVSSNLARYDGVRFGQDRSFFGEEAKRRIMLGTYTLSSGYYDAYYLRAERVRSLISEDFERVFQKVDVLLSPTTPSTALSIGATKGNAMFGEVQDILVEASSLSGLPGINLNCGFTQKGLPIGFQLIGPKFSENELLDLAEAYERQAGGAKRKPNLKAR